MPFKGLNQMPLKNQEYAYVPNKISTNALIISQALPFKEKPGT
jgi:hypothetical protein